MDILGHTNGILFVSICFDAITPITCHFPVKPWLVVLCMHHSEGRGCFRHIRRIALPRMQYTRPTSLVAQPISQPKVEPPTQWIPFVPLLRFRQVAPASSPLAPATHGIYTKPSPAHIRTDLFWSPCANKIFIEA